MSKGWNDRALSPQQSSKMIFLNVLRNSSRLAFVVHPCGQLLSAAFALRLRIACLRESCGAAMGVPPWVWLPLALCLGGCSTEIDHWGDSRIDHEATDRAIKKLQQQPPAESFVKIIPPADTNPRNLEDTDPNLLTIDFQSGFNGEIVEIDYAGQTAFGERLNSNRQGYADTVSVTFDDPSVALTVRIVQWQAERSFTVDVSEGRFLGISLKNGEVLLTLQELPFAYSP